MLWHEFCHVVTLHKTNNRMPRWLSEGISVYEERQADAAWGQSLTPEYRQMILGQDLTPVSQLSGAFLNPSSPRHLQFAYFQSALVVEFLVEHYGLETLKRMLVDLGAGMPISHSLERYAGSLQALDEQFAEYARQRARQFGPRRTGTNRTFRPARTPSCWPTGTKHIRTVSGGCSNRPASGSARGTGRLPSSRSSDCCSYARIIRGPTMPTACWPRHTANWAKPTVSETC